MTIILAILFPFAVQYDRGGYWRLMLPVTLLALLIDVIVNYTELALITWDWPHKGEYTFSTRLKRLRFNSDWRGVLCRPIVTVLNRIKPGHI